MKVTTCCKAAIENIGENYIDHCSDCKRVVEGATFIDVCIECNEELKYRMFDIDGTNLEEFLTCVNKECTEYGQS